LDIAESEDYRLAVGCVESAPGLDGMDETALIELLGISTRKIEIAR
jgi:hypothetical protein